MPFSSHFKRVVRKAAAFFKAEDGNAAMILAIAAIPILTAIGMAIDYTRAVNSRSAMQAALDATALMLAQDAPSLTAAQLSSKAQTYFNAIYNHPEVSGVTLTATYSQNSGSGSTVALAGSGSMPTDFMKVAGYPTMSINVTSTATWGNTKLRVALVLDNTGSMANNGKMTALQGGATNLIDQLSATASSNGDVYISIVPFVNEVNMGAQSYKNSGYIDWSNWSPNGSIEEGMTCGSGGGGGGWGWGGGGTQTCGSSANNISQWNGCVMDRTQSYDTTNDAPTSGNTLFPADQSSWCPQPIMPLSYNWTQLKQTISNMSPNGTTNQAIGLLHGWMTLLQTAPYNAPAESSNYSYNKAIILLTDGLNTQDRWYGDGFNTSTQVDDRQRILCDNIKAAGITIYSIQVNTEGDPQSSVLAYCASGSSNFFYLTSASEVLSTFNSIGTKLSKLRISK